MKYDSSEAFLSKMLNLPGLLGYMSMSLLDECSNIQVMPSVETNNLSVLQIQCYLGQFTVMCRC